VQEECVKKSEIVVPLVFGLLVLILVLLSVFFASRLIGKAPGVELALEPNSGFRIEAGEFLALADQALTLLTSVVFGLFVLLGFALKPRGKECPNFDWLDIVAGLLFLLTTFGAVFYAYSIRVSLFSFASFEYLGASAARSALLWHRELLGTMALVVGLSSAFAVFLAVRSLSRR
jgi:NADH:ubiquinone oxidoreductase subunit 3 (subunit A)